MVPVSPLCMPWKRDIRTIVSCGWLKTSTTELLRFSSRVLHWVEPHCSAEERTPEASIMVVLLCVCVCVCVCVYWYREPGQYSTHLTHKFYDLSIGFSELPEKWDLCESGAITCCWRHWVGSLEGDGSGCNRSMKPQ